MKCLDDRETGGPNKGSPMGPSCSGIIRVDSGLGIISLDETAGRMVGMRPETLLGRRLGDVIDLASLGNLMKSGISFNNQIVMIGTKRIVSDYVPIVEEDRVVGGMLSLLVTAPEGVADSNSALNELLRSTNAFMNCDHDGIVVVDRKGFVVLVNHAFAKVFDTTPQAMIGKHVYQAYPNSQPSLLPTIMETGQPLLGVTHYLNGKQVYANRFPLVKDGTVIGCVGKIVFVDVREITVIANRLQAVSETGRQRRDAPGRGSGFKYDIDSIIGQSRKIVELKEAILRVAPKSSNILLRGESGTGKELFAHAIHSASDRRYAPFIKVNCAAIPEHLLESELFGYAEGAFTGARKGGQIGKFEQAHTGTIFLDEIGDMPLSMQVKMLRILQEKELTQLGGISPRTVDVRVVAATNGNLEQLVREGKFREDLYYRFNVVMLTIPPLRERMEDVYPIVAGFIGQFNVEFGLQVQGLDDEAWDIIRRYDWPGNIRELRNVIESAFNVVAGPLIMREHLPDQLCRLFPRDRVEPTRIFAQGVGEFIRASLGKRDIGEIVEDFEKMLIHEAIELCSGNKLHAAQLLRISRQGLYKKLHKCAGEAVEAA